MSLWTSAWYSWQTNFECHKSLLNQSQWQPFHKRRVLEADHPPSPGLLHPVPSQSASTYRLLGQWIGPLTRRALSFISFPSSFVLLVCVPCSCHPHSPQGRRRLHGSVWMSEASPWPYSSVNFYSILFKCKLYNLISYCNRLGDFQALLATPCLSWAWEEKSLFATTSVEHDDDYVKLLSLCLVR